MLSGSLLGLTNAGDENIPEKIVASRNFTVTVKPADSKSLDAEAADLYITRFPQRGWVLDGECRIQVGTGEKLFAKAVSVPSDGVYYFTSRGADAVGKSPAPLRGDTPQVKVIADTTAPEFSLHAPEPGRIFREGEEIRIEWIASDRNLALNPVELEYSTDNGINWRIISRDIPNTGHYFWKIPQAGNFMLRGRCIDRAGNVTRAEPNESWKVMPKLRAPVVVNEEVVVAPKIPTAPIAAVTPEAAPLVSEVKPTVKAQPEKSKSAAVDDYTKHLKDPRPASKHPELDANNGDIPRVEQKNGKAAYIAYIMAGNLVRQGRLKDSLRYYRTAVDIDENFDQAWNDMALVYKQLGAYSKADACIMHALKVKPDSPRYINTRGGIYQASGFEILRDPSSGDESLARASDLILFSVKTYGQAIDSALKQGRLAECAETYFHLGEICYFANQDPQGARQYWTKVLDLHSPTPDLDNVVLDRDTPQEKLTRTIYEKNTELWVNLNTWQSWSREYLRQLNRLEQGAAVPKAPFVASHFQRFENPNLGANTQPMAASQGVYGLRQDGNYSGTDAYAGMGGSGQRVVQQTQPYYYNNQGQPVAAPTNHPMVVGQQPVDPRTYYLKNGQCPISNTQQYSGQTSQQAQQQVQAQDQNYPRYVYDGAVTQQSQMQARENVGQGVWNNQNYGSTPDYTYKTQNSQ